MSSGHPRSIRRCAGPGGAHPVQPSTVTFPARSRVRLIRIQSAADSESERGSSGRRQPPGRLVLVSTTSWSSRRPWVDLSWGLGARCDALGTLPISGMTWTVHWPRPTRCVPLSCPSSAAGTPVGASASTSEVFYRPLNTISFPLRSVNLLLIPISPRIRLQNGRCSSVS